MLLVFIFSVYVRHMVDGVYSIGGHASCRQEIPKEVAEAEMRAAAHAANARDVRHYTHYPDCAFICSTSDTVLT
jgi:hypothetical protein